MRFTTPWSLSPSKRPQPNQSRTRAGTRAGTRTRTGTGTGTGTRAGTRTRTRTRTGTRTRARTGTRTSGTRGYGLSLTVDLRHAHAAVLTTQDNGLTKHFDLTPRVQRRGYSEHAHPQGIRLPISLALTDEPEATMKRLHALGQFSSFSI